jgi:hypothetical protein
MILWVPEARQPRRGLRAQRAPSHPVARVQHRAKFGCHKRTASHHRAGMPRSNQWRLMRPDGCRWSDAPARPFDRLWNGHCARRSSAGRCVPAFDSQLHARWLSTSVCHAGSSAMRMASSRRRDFCSPENAKPPLWPPFRDATSCVPNPAHRCRRRATT